MSSNSRRLLKYFLCFGFLAGLPLWSTVAAKRQAGPAAKIDFQRDIQPIFAAACASCHGAKKAAGQLRLDLKSAALKGGLSGPLLMPGDSKQSRLLARILSHEGEGGEPRMPLGGAPLKPEQIELIRRWIDEGAAWPETEAAIRHPQSALPQHWAYVKPVRPALLSVKNQAWVRNAIDAFILARLEKEGLAPAPAADRTTLLRRVYLDLIGLPPTPKEVDAFLADQSKDAYEKVVDRLLASPHYGERWARPWLDLARYADSHGYEKDRPRVMWKYRDWIVNALNQDMPFDQFTIEQLAGDMLPNPTHDQLIATGFHRNTMLNQEGGVDDEEARWETLIDRVNTTSTVWLGSTLGCAQCHNHKYDPFSQKDYYKFFAFFDSHDYYLLEMPGSEGWVIEPELELPTPEQAAQRDKLRAELKTVEATLKTQTPALNAAQAQWEAELRAAPRHWQTLDPLTFKSASGTKLEKLADKSLLASGTVPVSETYTLEVQLPASAAGLTALRLEALADAKLPQGGPGRNPYGNFVLSGIEMKLNGQAVLLKEALADDSSGRPDARQLFSPGEVPGNGWAIDATRDETRQPRQLVLTFAQPLKLSQTGTATILVKQIGQTVGQGLGRVRLAVTESTDPTRIVSLPLRFQAMLETPAARRTTKQQDALAEQFRSMTPLLKAERDRVRSLRDAIGNLGIVTAQIMREKQSYERPSTYLRVRGNYISKGEQVYAATPASLHAFPESAPINRLGLARWLVSRDNPLTARVTVNRHWEQFFGRGIVETSEDFGTQSSPPTHPELLDWLAVEFMESGQGMNWSMKKLHRLIVTSATYRQSSKVTPAQLEKDSYNRLLARGPRFRLEAETIRDSALVASGLLARQLGGPPVYPVQPDGIWMNPYDGASIRWQTSQGGDRYRRSLYTFLRRTAPYPMLTNFDATSREFCTVKRTRTNTPLQALNLLNDEALLDLARALARRMLTEVSGDLKTRLGYGFRLCVARPPSAAELAKLEQLYQRQLDIYRADPANTQQLAKGLAEAGTPAEAAALTMVANVLLNLDEMLTKE
jgi:hypothetical protein